MALSVWFLTLPGVMALDITGPAETLRLAGDDTALHYIGPDDSVLSSTQMTFSGILPLPDTLPAGSVLIIPGLENSQQQLSTPQAQAARAWLVRQQQAIRQQQITLVCICAGALLAAQAGLLDGIACTTHHQVIARLQACAPRAKVLANRIFVEDNGIWTSAGITTGIDLSLHLINRFCGPQQALSVAREMVVWFRRSGEDPQLSPWLRYRNHLHPALHRAQDLISQHPQHPWPLAELARQGHVSSRHLTRLFAQHLGISVGYFHRQLRVALVRQRLQQGEGVEKAAMAAGFSTARQYRRALLQLASQQDDDSLQR